jgi:hypothetical protein
MRNPFPEEARRRKKYLSFHQEPDMQDAVPTHVAEEIRGLHAADQGET